MCYVHNQWYISCATLYVQSSYLLGGLETQSMQLCVFIITDMLSIVMLRIELCSSDSTPNMLHLRNHKFKKKHQFQ